MVLSGI